MIKLKRPLVFFDLETTGVDTQKDRIVEIAMVKLYPNFAREEMYFLVNPGIPIPEGAAAIHGITDEHVKDSPLFSEVADEVLGFMSDCDLAGFNSNFFDIPLLMRELERTGRKLSKQDFKAVDVCAIYRRTHARTLINAVKDYLGGTLDDAHSAVADTSATVDVFLAQTIKHKELPDTVEEIETYCNNDNPMVDLAGKFKYNDEGVIVFNFGKNKDIPATQDLSYLNWMINSDFTGDTKEWCIRILNNQN